MALGKGKENKEVKADAKQEHKHLDWLPVEEVLKSKKEIKNGVNEYTLAFECTATIYDEQESINVTIWGISIWAKIRESKKGNGGYFVSWPSYKKSDGSYGDYVKVFDGALLKLLSELITKHIASMS